MALHKGSMQMPGIMGIMESSSQLTRRIEMITKENHWKIRWTLLALGLCLLVSVATLIRVQYVEAQPDSDKLVELRLTVIDEEKKPVPDTQVKWEYGDGQKLLGKTDKDGRLVEKIPLTTVKPFTQLSFYHQARGLKAGESFWSIPEDWTPNKPIELTVTTFKSRRLTGTVVDQEGKPVADACVFYSMDPSSSYATTDKDGKFELDTMPFQSLMIYAVHATLGAATAYPDFPPEEAWKGEGYVPDDWEETQRNNGPFTMKLERGETITVRVVDKEGKPIEGLFVAPTYFSTETSFWNPISAKETLRKVTDKNGTAEFRWIPTSTYKFITFEAWGTDPRFAKNSPASRYGNGSAVWRTEEKNNNLAVQLPERVIQLPNKIMLEGSVRYADGSIPRPMQIHLIGKDYRSVGDETDFNGNFVFFANANEIVSLHPIYNSRRQDRPGIAPPKLRVDVGNGKKSVPRFDFVLKPGTKVTGKLSNARLKTFVMSGPEDTVDNQNEWFGVWNQVDDGYELILPPGRYRFKVDDKVSDVVLEIREGDKEKQLDLK
jgi:hypothetical protein